MTSLLIALLLASGRVDTARSTRPTNPVVIIWELPVAKPTFDDEEALADFEFYSGHIKASLRELHPEVETIVSETRRVTLGNGTVVTIPKSAGTFGFILMRSGSKRLILRGVLTDSDFACLAARYFLWQLPEDCPAMPPNSAVAPDANRCFTVLLELAVFARGPRR